AVAEVSRVRLCDAHTGKQIAQLDTKKAWEAVSFDVTGERLVTGGALGIWDTKTRKLVRVFQHEDGSARPVLISPHGKRVVSAHGNYLRVWDAETGGERLAMSGHRYQVRGVAWSRDGKRIATGSGGDGSFRLWDASTGEMTRVIRMEKRRPALYPDSDLSMLAFSSDGRSLVTPGWRWPLSGSLDPVQLPERRTSAHSPDGRYFALDCRGEGVEIQDVTGRTLHRLRPGKGKPVSVSSLAFSPNGRLLALSYAETADRDEKQQETVQLWDVATGKFVRGLGTGGGW